MEYFASIDQGTTSSRFIVFDQNGKIGVWFNWRDKKKWSSGIKRNWGGKRKSVV